jgi:hypothetical protein
MVSIICFVSAFHAALKLARLDDSWCRHGINVYSSPKLLSSVMQIITNLGVNT